MAEYNTEKRRVNYCCGMNPSSVKKMCTFIFGEYFHGLKVNQQSRDFELFVYKELEGLTFIDKFGKEFIEYFKDYWGEKPGFKIVYYLGIRKEDL